ncbi:hypothetical protein Droror1_Dr00007835 [Drosera rotundifolia]
MDFSFALLLAVAVCFVASAVDATTRMTLNCVGCGSEDYSPTPAPSPETEPIEGEETVFSVMDYGAVGNEETDDGEAFLSAWAEACTYHGKSALLIPERTFLVGALTLEGPCHRNNAPTILIRGTLKAPDSLSDLGQPSWVVFRHLRGLTIRGADGASLDGQGEEAWNGHRHCLHKSKCGSLPRSLRFENVSNGNIGNIALLNSKGFHMSFSECQNITIHDMSITAPWDSPNTDGIHVSDSSNIRITSSTIRTGDDCVSIGPGSFNVSVSKVTCGPGHGISIGSLGRYKHEKNVAGIVVVNCTIIGTENGVRIKTWPGSPPSQASKMMFENIVMIDVSNPIVIDQEYCPSGACTRTEPSLVQLSKICFKNIRGTSRTTPVTLKCSSRVPCVNVTVFDIDVTNIKAKKHKQSMWNLQGGLVGLEIDTNGPEQPWWNLENWSWSKE